MTHENVTFNNNGTLSTIPNHPLLWRGDLSEGRQEDDIFYLPNIALLVSNVGFYAGNKSRDCVLNAPYLFKVMQNMGKTMSLLIMNIHLILALQIRFNSVKIFSLSFNLFIFFSSSYSFP